MKSGELFYALVLVAMMMTTIASLVQVVWRGLVRRFLKILYVCTGCSLFWVILLILISININYPQQQLEWMDKLDETIRICILSILVSLFISSFWCAVVPVQPMTDDPKTGEQTAKPKKK